VLGSGRCRHLVSERDHRAITASAGQAVWWHQRTAILCCPKGHRCRAKSRNRAGELGGGRPHCSIPSALRGDHHETLAAGPSLTDDLHVLGRHDQARDVLPEVRALER
jgi:hypothetical protein